MFCRYVFVLLCNMLKRRQCSLFKIFRIMCLLLLRILFQPVGKLPEQWDENQHKSHGSHSTSVASGLCYFIQHSAFTALRYMKFTILIRWIATSGFLACPLMRWAQFCFSGTEIQYFLCHEVWIHVSTMPWFSWMISNFLWFSLNYLSSLSAFLCQCAYFLG